MGREGLLSVADQSSDEIRAAYKKESLRTHPDRLPGTASAAERRKATERFVSSPLAALPARAVSNGQSCL